MENKCKLCGKEASGKYGDIPICFSHYDKAEFLDDGLGNIWLKACSKCHKDIMQIVRPGKVQCPECD